MTSFRSLRKCQEFVCDAYTMLTPHPPALIPARDLSPRMPPNSFGWGTAGAGCLNTTQPDNISVTIDMAP